MLPTWAANGCAERTANRVTPATSEPCPPCGSQELLWLRAARNTMVQQRTVRCLDGDGNRSGLLRGAVGLLTFKRDEFLFLQMCSDFLQSGRESGTGTILTRWGVLDYGSAMPRTARVAPGGMVFHVLNRGVARMQLFEKAADYQAFEQVLRDTFDQSPMRICAYAVMPNHWHLLLWPECDGELAAFMQRLTITHVRRWQEHRGYAGLGHVYQGRYKSFPVESDEHFWVVARYVECAPISSCERRNGGGQACGNLVLVRD